MTVWRPPRAGVSWPDNLNTGGRNLNTCGPGSWASVRFPAPGLTGILGTEPSHVTEEITVHPAISLFLARARIADLHDQARRKVLARTASRDRRREGGT